MPRRRGSWRLAFHPVVPKLIVALLMTAGIVVASALPAVADETCYTACGPGPAAVVGSGVQTSPGVPVPGSGDSIPSSGGLPFTGSDIGPSVAVAGGLVVVGLAMVRAGRRTRRARHAR